MANVTLDGEFVVILSSTTDLSLEESLFGYRKIPMISPGLIFVQKAFLLGLFSGDLTFGGVRALSERILRFKMGLACQ